MNMPAVDDLRFAAEWLRAYDDPHDGGEQTAVAAKVAEWLDEQAEAKYLRDAAREAGVTVPRFRAKLKQMQAAAFREFTESV